MTDSEAKLILALLWLGIITVYAGVVWLVTLPDRNRRKP
jgi:hypothetical protein